MAANEDLTEDALLGGRVRLFQPRKGYRVAVDPVLLAAAVPAEPGQTVLDVGCGSGAVALCLLARRPDLRITGIELDPAMADLANRNAAANGVADRFHCLTGDLFRPVAELKRGHDHVVSNPPYAAPGTASPDPDRARSHGAVDLVAWLRACMALVTPDGGWLSVILRADALHLALPVLAERLGAISVMPLWPKAGEPARRVILRGRKGSRAGSVIHPGLVLHEADGPFTAVADKLLRPLGEPPAFP